MNIKKNATNPTIYEPGFKIFNNWMKLKHSGKTLQKFFDDNYIYTVAIYGMGELGKRLYEELENLELQVLYAIDKNADNIDVVGLNIINLDHELENVDAVIVTPVHFFNDIEKQLFEKGIKNVVSLEDVVMYCL